MISSKLKKDVELIMDGKGRILRTCKKVCEIRRWPYLYDTRNTGESGELIGGSLTGGGRHQAEEGGLQDTEKYSQKNVPKTLQLLICLSK